MQFVVFILTYFVLAFNVIGYGYFFAKNLTSYNKSPNIGYKGLYGITFLTLISYLTNLILKHDYSHNFVIQIIGIFFFFYYSSSIKNLKQNKEVRYLLFFLTLSITSILYFKSHDDFLYYHLSFIDNLTINKLEFGLGNFDLAFNHVSSLFFFHSLFKLPFTENYFYFIGPALIMVFTNVILVKSIFERRAKLNFNFFLKLFIFIFINIFFYRLAEHGTDRSAIILILLSILLIFNILEKKKLNHQVFENFIILLTLIVSLKSFYTIYGLLFLVIFFKYFTISNLRIFYKNFKIINFSIIFALLIIFYNIAYTGCLIYPLSYTCFESFYWGLDVSRVEWAASFYELWSKAGATPTYRVDNPENYISGFNWLTVWIENYFFNKVSDTIVGLILAVLIFFIIFKPKKIKFEIIREHKIIYFALLLYAFEWFFYHPSLRYGGYHLLALIFFIPASILLSSQGYNYTKNFRKIQLILLIGIVIFSYRNIDRIINENVVYNYNPLISPRYKIDLDDYYLKNKKKIIFENTKNCNKEFKKEQNCKIVNSYRVFY